METQKSMLQRNHDFIVDGMARVPQLKTSGLTFEEFSNNLQKQVIHASGLAFRTDMVFDVPR